MITTRDAKALHRYIERSGGVVILSLHEAQAGVFQIDLALAKDMPQRTPMGYAHPEKANAEAGRAFLALGRYMLGMRPWPKRRKR